MDTLSHTMASAPTTCNTKMIFKFFSLPAELRDMIYDHLWQEIEEATDNLRFNICTTIPELRLVNGQFKFEYDERIAANEHNNTVAVTQLYDSSPYDPSEEVYLPRLAAQSTSLTITIISQDDDCGACHRCRRHKRCEHSAHYREWVRHWLLSDLPLQACQVNLSMTSRRCVPEAMANQKFITDLLEHFGEFSNLNIFGPKSEKEDAGEPVLLATHSGVSTEEKKAEMLKLANVVAESVGEPLWY